LAGGGFALAVHDTSGDGSQRRRNGGRQRPATPTPGCRISPGSAERATKRHDYAESGGKTQVGRLALAAVGRQENCRRAMKEVKLALSGGCFELP